MTEEDIAAVNFLMAGFAPHACVHTRLAETHSFGQPIDALDVTVDDGTRLRMLCESDARPAEVARLITSLLDSVDTRRRTG